MLTSPTDKNIEKTCKTILTSNIRTSNNIVSLDMHRSEKRLSDAKRRIREAAGKLNWQTVHYYYQILAITKGDGYVSPKQDWLSGTITTDLIELLNTTKRQKYIADWFCISGAAERPKVAATYNIFSHFLTYFYSGVKPPIY